MSEVIINNVKFKNVPDKRYGTKIGDLLTQSNVGMSQAVADYIQSDDFYAIVNGVDIDWNSIEVEDGLVLDTTADLINWIISIINKIPLVKIISVIFSTEVSFPTSEEIQQLLGMPVQDFAQYGSKYQYYFYLKKEQKYYFIPAAYNKNNTNIIYIRGIDDIAVLSFNESYGMGVLSFSEKQAPDLSNYYTKEEVNTLFDSKVDKIIGKGLSTNDYTNADKDKVAAALTQHQDISGKADVAAINAEVQRAQTAEGNLQQLYESLSQSQPVPVTALPATGEAGKIYRLAGVNSYADYMYNESDLTTPIKMAEYDNAIDDEPTAGSDNMVKSGGVFAMEYNKDTYSFIKRLFNTSLYDGTKEKRAGYYIKNDGSSQQNSDYDLWVIQTWPSGTDDIKAFVVETTYTNPVEDVPTVQVKETESLTPENVINVSYKRGTNKILVSVSPSDTCKILTVVCDANTVPTICVLSPKYDIYDERILQLINNEIVESVSFIGNYEYTNDKFYPIPKGAVITGVSGASTSVNGYNADKSDHITLVEGVVVPYQIDFLRAIDYTGQITLKYKSLYLSELAAEKTRAIAVENSLNEENNALDRLYHSVFNGTVNLANPDDFEEGYYVSYETGRLSENQNYTASGYIPVTAGQSYYISYKHQIAWYDESKAYVSGSSKSDNNPIQTAPSNACYLRCTIGNEAVSTFIVAQSSQAIPYTPYGDTIKENAIAPNSIAPDKLKPQSPTNKAYLNAIGNVASGDMIETTDFPFFVKKGLAMAFYAKIVSFDTLYIGKGYNKYRGHWVKIDSTNITIEWYESSVITIATVAHGLTFSDYIKVNIVQNNDGTTDIILQTLGGDFKYTVTDVSYEWNHELFVRSTNTILTDATLTATIQDIDKPIWLFGDSYFGVNNERVIGQLKNIGLFNYLVEGLAGEDSISAYADLQRLLTLGKPKYIVWCLGMNDTDANFTTYFNNVKSYCDRYGITMIGYTVPTVPSRNKETISALVRNSGLRYIDAYKAVGTDADGNWYTGYLSSDGVHPTARGAKAIALQWTIDFPELYIYCRYKDDVILQNSVGVDN